jgi:hypothetical protein
MSPYVACKLSSRYFHNSVKGSSDQCLPTPLVLATSTILRCWEMFPSPEIDEAAILIVLRRSFNLNPCPLDFLIYPINFTAFFRYHKTSEQCAHRPNCNAPTCIIRGHNESCVCIKQFPRAVDDMCESQLRHVRSCGVNLDWLQSILLIVCGISNLITLACITLSL